MRLLGARPDRWDLVEGRLRVGVTVLRDREAVWATFVAEHGVTRERLDEVRSILSDAGIEVDRFALLGEPVGGWVADARAVIDAANAALGQ